MCIYGILVALAISALRHMTLAQYPMNILCYFKKSVRWYYALLHHILHSNEIFQKSLRVGYCASLS